MCLSVNHLRKVPHGMQMSYVNREYSIGSFCNEKFLVSIDVGWAKLSGKPAARAVTGNNER
jgi:hypothetical protein